MLPLSRYFVRFAGLGRVFALHGGMRKSHFREKLLAISCLMVVFVGVMANVSAQGIDTLRGVTTTEGQRIPFTVIVKHSGYDEHYVHLPVILFLHGAGERGTDNQLQLTVGLPRLMQSMDELSSDGYVIIAPQCPVDQKWVDTDWTALSHAMSPTICPTLGAAAAIVDSMLWVSKGYFDQSRIYVTGVSMGGFGTWDLVQRYPNKFAAAMPICGGGDLAQAPALKAMPIWAFHGQKDKLVKTTRSTDMVQAVRAAGGIAKMTIYPDLGHLCWNTAYKDLEAIQWLLSQTRKDE